MASISLPIMFFCIFLQAGTTIGSNMESERLDEAFRVLDFNGHFQKFLSVIHKNSKIVPRLKSHDSLTIFAPSDKAFDAVVPKLNISNLDSSRMDKLLKYHILPKYYTYWAFARDFRKPIHTLATSNSRHDFVLQVYPGFFISTGVNVARIFSKIFDRHPVVVYVVTEVLIPKEIMGAPSPPPPVFSPPPPVFSPPPPVFSPPPPPPPVFSPPPPVFSPPPPPPPVFAPPPPPPSVPSDNVCALRALADAGHFKKFLSLLKSAHLVSKILRLKSFTMFAPTDYAFQALAEDVSGDNNRLDEILKYHVVPAYYGPWMLIVETDPVRTLASKGKKNKYVLRFKLDLNATRKVDVDTGVIKAHILGMVYNEEPVAVYAIDQVLLPIDIFEAAH